MPVKITAWTGHCSITGQLLHKIYNPWADICTWQNTNLEVLGLVRNTNNWEDEETDAKAPVQMLW